MISGYPHFDYKIADIESKQELLEQVVDMELRDQLEAKEQMIKELKERIDKSCNKLHAIEMLLRYHNNICASSIENVELYLKTGLPLPFGFYKATEEAK